jgi:Zn-finger nucleic acid-binding protein
MTSCGSCGAPREYDRGRLIFTCRHCGTEEPVPVGLQAFDLADPSGLECPSCRGSLLHAAAGGRPIQVCSACHGALVAMSSFMAVVAVVRFFEGQSLDVLPMRQQKPGDRQVACPSCGHAMRSHLYGGPGNIVMDTCEHCELNWLDKGELRRIALAPDSRPAAARA